MDRGWRIGVAAAVVLASVALGACDDGDDDEVVTQEAYDQEATSLCDRFGADLTDAASAVSSRASDAERVSLLRAELVPNARSIVQSLESFGYPPAESARYNQAEAVALNALDEIEEDAPELVDRLMAGSLLDEESPFVDLREALSALDVPC